MMIHDKLQNYLQCERLTQADFARDCSVAFGYRIPQSTVSRWLSGERKPGPAGRRAIELATNGEIGADQWL
jgi:transcriptional regulator with XRE-family HTH domain